MFNANQKRLLALDGGGILGVMSLCILKRIEDQLRPLSGMDENFRLCHFFDYIGGTSTGAIIAAGLAIGKSCSELIDFCLLYTSPSPRDRQKSRMPSSA